MKFIFNKGGLILDKGKWHLFIEIPTEYNNFKGEIEQLIKQEKPKMLELKIKRNKRSLDANAALWVMLDKMAHKLSTTKEELYLIMLERYGKFTPVIIEKSLINEFKRQYKTLVEESEFTSKGVTYINLHCYHGSSTFNTKEFSRLLEGVINEAKEIGVEFISKEDMSMMMQNYKEPE